VVGQDDFLPGMSQISAVGIRTIPNHAKRKGSLEESHSVALFHKLEPTKWMKKVSQVSQVSFIALVLDDGLHDGVLLGDHVALRREGKHLQVILAVVEAFQDLMST